MVHPVSPPVNGLISTMVEFLNLCQDGVNAPMRLAVLLKNNDTMK
jgi:hypothetical protein